MLYITGDECGLLKETNTAYLKSHRKLTAPSSQYGIVAAPTHPNKSGGIAVQCLNASDGMSRQTGVVQITSLCSRSNCSEKEDFAALRANGSIQLWRRQLFVDPLDVHSKRNEYQKCATIPNVFHESIKNESNVYRSLSMGLLSHSSGVENGAGSKLAVSNSMGTVVVVDPSIYESSTNEDVLDHRGVITCYSPLCPQHPLSEKSRSPIQRSIVSTFCTHSTNHWFVLGGKDRDIAVYDVSSASSGPFWKAKNLPPHPQTLLQPQIWPTAVCFMNQLAMDSSSDLNHSNLLLVGTAYRQIRIYDLRTSQRVGTLQHKVNVQRRPIFHSDEKQPIVDHCITAICPLSNHSFLIGDGGGTILSYDYRCLSDFQSVTDRGGASSKSAVTGRFVGPAGSVRQLTTLPGHKQFACVGLDRMLRIYDVASRRQRSMIYLKQRLNTVLMLSSGTNDDDDDASPKDDDIDQEDSVRDYSDSENESHEDEDDVVEEMIDALDREDSNEASFASEDDDDDDEEEACKIIQKKRKRQ